MRPKSARVRTRRPGTVLTETAPAARASLGASRVPARRAGTLAVVVVVGLVGCSSASPPLSATSATATPSAPATPSATPPLAEPDAAVRPVRDPVVIASRLAAPWSVLRLPNGATLISERDTALVRELLADGGLRDAGAVPGARPSGEGGLLGLAFLADAAAAGASGWVYAYYTSATDNRIERMPLLGAPGALALGAPEPVLAGIPRAGNHDGGRIAFGPDGLLYATVGDAGNTGTAQNRDSLGGKILRMTPTGGVPTGAGAAANPFGSLVYSWGHRNPQGIAWDSAGILWASEFGQKTWDELNRIEPGGNYGWPIVEGVAGAGADPAFIDPVQQWATSEASPSGIAIVNDTLFMTGLRGARLWRIDLRTVAKSAAANDPSTVTMDDWFVNSYGRLRDVVSGPAGTLWFISNNTDGRGDPSSADDRLYEVEVAP